MGLGKIKRGLIAFSLAFSLLLAGCITDTPASETSDNPKVENPATETSANSETTNTDVEENSDNPADQSNSEGKKPIKKKDSGNIDEKSKGKDDDNKGNGEDGKGKSSGKGEDKSQEHQQESSGDEGKQEEDSIVLPNKIELPVHVIAGIGATLLLLTAVIIWLLYDRKKKKPGPHEVDNGLKSQVLTQKQGGATVSIGLNSQLAFRVGNLHNIGRREEQQDSFYLSDILDEEALHTKGLLAVVADGMGGMEGGAAISQLVTDTFRDYYAKKAANEPTTFLYEAAQTAEIAVEDYMRRTGIDGGSTLVAVLIQGNGLNFLSVGDSRIYIVRGQDLIQLNHEHTFGAVLKEKAAKGEVDPDEPFKNPRRDALIAYIGMGSFNTIDRSDKPIVLAAGDKVLLCSDGVFNTLGKDSIVKALQGDALTAAGKLEEDILSRAIPEQDNFTGVILECVDTNKEEVS